MAFTLQVVNNALFFHSHKTASGKIFHHAHPNGGNHSHSDCEFSFYEQQQLLCNSDINPLVAEVPFQFKITFEPSGSGLNLSLHFNCLSHRGPPVC